MNVINADPAVHNPADPVGGFAGMPRNMTGIATVISAQAADSTVVLVGSVGQPFLFLAVFSC